MTRVRERNLDIEAAILADPESPHGYAVYADWLVERGDPHGELIAVQLARETKPDDATLVAHERELLDALRAELLDGAAFDFLLSRPPALEWRRGFLHAAEVRTSYESNDGAIAVGEIAS